MRITNSSLLVLSWMLLAACEGPLDLIRDPLLDRWCGERPCNWEVEGDIDRIGTWHAKDYAVRFTGDDSRLSQLNSNVSDLDATCFAFTMLAKVGPGVKLYLELDFFDDGEVDLQQRIPEGNWDYRAFFITPPTWFEGVRFILRKDGSGYAALAQLTARTSEDCTQPAIDLGPRPGGARCDYDYQCQTGECASVDAGLCWFDDECGSARGTCGGCRSDADCADASLCAPLEHGDDPAQACSVPGSAGFGKPCARSEECATGVCCEGACSTCCADGDCRAGQQCAPPGVEALDGGSPDAGHSWPRLCAPGEGEGSQGDTCTGDADCQSGVCRGGSAYCSVFCDVDPDQEDCVRCNPVIGGACE